MPYTTCYYCNRTLYPGIGRRDLSNGRTICDRCTDTNEHLREYPDAEQWYNPATGRLEWRIGQTHTALHPADRQMLDTWYSDLVKRLVQPGNKSHDRQTYTLLDGIKAIGDVLYRRK